METITRLNHIVADMTILSQKARLCHWNVEGPGFLDYHGFFGKFYDFLSEEVDEFAERIRAFDEFPIATYAQMLETASIKEKTEIPSKEMISELLSDTEHFVSELRTWIKEEEDEVTQDMYIGLTQELEKKIWMMRSMKRSGVIG